MASLLNGGILIDIEKYYKKDFNDAYEKVKDIKVSEETVHYLIGYMSKESTFYKEKDLYQTEDKEVLKKLGSDISKSILKDLYGSTDLSQFKSTYESKFFLFYFLNRSNRFIPHDAVYKSTKTEDKYLFFGNEKPETVLIEKGMNKAFKNDITSYGLFPIKLPTGLLVGKDGLLKREEDKIEKLEHYYQGIYHTIMVHDFFMKKLVESKYEGKEMIKLFLPVLESNKHYLFKFYSRKKPLADTSSPFTNKILNGLSLKDTLNEFDLTSVFDAPYFKMYKTKNDINKDFSKEKDNIFFILELDVPVDGIIFEGNMELYNSSVDVAFVKDTDFIRTRKVNETNFYSLYAQKNPKALHFLDYNNIAMYHLKDKDVWITMKVEKKSNSTTNKYLFKMNKPLNDLSLEKNPKNSAGDTIVSPLYSSGFMEKKSFEEYFGFDVFPSLTKIEKEIDLFIINK